MVKYEDMTKEERDRFISIVLSEKDIEKTSQIYLAIKKTATTDDVLRFCFNVATNKMTPAHLKKSRTANKDNPK